MTIPRRAIHTDCYMLSTKLMLAVMGALRVTLAKDQGMGIFFEATVIKLIFRYQNTLAAGLPQVA